MFIFQYFVMHTKIIFGESDGCEVMTRVNRVFPVMSVHSAHVTGIRDSGEQHPSCHCAGARVRGRGARRRCIILL